jgi:orotidine-5'-phosphate decarboxylase
MNEQGSFYHTVKIIVALDFDTEREAMVLVQALGDAAEHYKIGIQTLTAVGPSLPRMLIERGKHVFLDLKLHEIPNSVASAVRAAGKLGAGMVTVHASAGSVVLRAAVEAARPFPGLRVLALTVITSLSDSELPEIGLAPSVESQVERLASLAWSAGCHGVVASVQEAAVLRSKMPPQSLIVCPGIQLPDSSKTDQARTAMPASAARSGATHIVVGRAVTAASSPLEAFRQIRGELK